jgi:crotonobetainyl-CoA:carnitine CoA-transferase CaiB-like acyl-CoA transferase
MPLDGLVVVDLSEGIPGGYCTKWLADAGAEVVKLEPPDGDPLRQWAIGATLEKGTDGALFEFLAANKRSVVIDPSRALDRELATSLLQAAELVVWSAGQLTGAAGMGAEAVHQLAPAAAVIAITPFGLTGPWSGRPATEFTLQAWSGGIAGRGSPERPPAHAGGRPGLWLAGITAATAALTAHQRVSATGRGELVDVSILETLTLMLQMYPVVRKTMLPVPTTDELQVMTSKPDRRVTIPSIERASDGWVGFMVATSTMWEMFSLMVGHPEWPEDTATYAYAGRAARRAELEPAIADWAVQHSVAEILQLAQDYRVPAAPIGTGETVASFDHFIEGGFFLPSATGRFLQPDVPYTLHSRVSRRPPGRAPSLGAHTGAERVRRRIARPAPSSAAPPRPLPLAGLRVADFTAFWAGPIVGHYLAMQGADVIHVEAPAHPDGIRAHTIKTIADEQWWEYSPLFNGPNTNKRDVTIDMSTDRGRDLALQLIAHCDVIAENYSPRVMEHWGIDDATVRAVRPDIIFLRMPAFGLAGSWRDRTGYAQNMEQASGMAWVTGFREGPPHVPNGVCDPLAGTHATAALLLALEHRRRTGEGMMVEVAMIGGALNVAAEQVIEYTAYGHLMGREGNRGVGAPQNLYLTSDMTPGGLRDTWVAIAVEDDAQWEALRRAVGDPAWFGDLKLACAEGRRAAHDDIDRHLARWCAARPAEKVIATLWPAGVPVGKVVAPGDTDLVEQHVARGYFERVVHPLTGENLHPGYPARSSAGPRRFHRSPAPMLGQHNREILGGLLGLTDRQLASLEAEGIIGTQLRGEHRSR